MKKLILLLGIAIAFNFAIQNKSYGQIGSPVPGTDPLLLSIFKEVKGFSSPATISIKKGNDTMNGDIDFAYSDGKVRISLDMTKFKGEAMAAETINILKQMGMDNVVSIAGTSSNFNYIIYPSLKSYVEVGYKEGAADEKKMKFEKTDLGEEVVVKQKCKKNKIVATDSAGNKQEAIVWNAPNIKGFPLQIKMKDSDNEVTMLFKNPKVETPSADLFKVPEGYKKYGSFEELMKSAVERAMQNQKK